MPDDSRVDGAPGPGPPAAGRHISSGMILAVVCVGQFMVVLDLSIVNVALPSMQRDLGFTTAGLQWVINAYALAFGGFLLLGGRAADLFGRRRIFMLGLCLFAGASLVCAVAQDQAMLVAARALQGLGAAVLSPATLTILTVTFRAPAERARALGIWSAMAAVGGASGALLGGILTDLLSWRWIFYINLPVAAAALVAARVVLAETRAEGARPSLDVPGAVTVTGGLVALVYAVAGTDTHAWSSTATVVPLLVAGAFLVAFVVVETRLARAPLVPFRLFRSRGLSAANVAMLLVGGAMFSMWFFISLYMQDVLGYSPLKTGLGFLPQSAAIIIGKPDLSGPVPVRLHSACLTGDVFCSRRCDCGDQLRLSLARLQEAGGGIVLYLAQEGRGLGLANKMRAYQLQDAGLDTIDANRMLGFEDDERTYDVAARMLKLLGCRCVFLLTNNPAKVEGLAAAGIEIGGRMALVTPINSDNRRYLTAKAARAGHRLHHLTEGLAQDSGLDGGLRPAKLERSD